MQAEDTVISGVDDLQKLTDSVNTIANHHGLYVNLNKTKIVDFRISVIVKPEERCYLNGNPIAKFDDVFI